MEASEALVLYLVEVVVLEVEVEVEAVVVVLVMEMDLIQTIQTLKDAIMARKIHKNMKNINMT